MLRLPFLNVTMPYTLPPEKTPLDSAAARAPGNVNQSAEGVMVIERLSACNQKAEQALQFFASRRRSAREVSGNAISVLDHARAHGRHRVDSFEHR